MEANLIHQYSFFVLCVCVFRNTGTGGLFHNKNAIMAPYEVCWLFDSLVSCFHCNICNINFFQITLRIHRQACVDTLEFLVPSRPQHINTLDVKKEK